MKAFDDYCISSFVCTHDETLNKKEFPTFEKAATITQISKSVVAVLLAFN